MATPSNPSAGPPKDRNAAVRERLLKKNEQARQVRAGLDAGELVDDAFARGMASFGKWLRVHSKQIQTAIVAAAVVGAGYAVYDWRQVKRAEAATTALSKALLAERGRVVPPDSTAENASTPSDDDPTPVFKSVEEKREKAIADYRALAGKYSGSGAALLAKLGEAGVLFEQRKFDEALAAYREVKGSGLAAADVSVRARCLEGIGLSLEAKKDTDGAQAAFRELENTDVRGYKQLGQFHGARLLLARGDEAKGDRAAAIEKLKAAYEKLQAETAQGPYGPKPLFPYLQGQVEDLLRSLDPSAVSPKKSGGFDPEKMMELQEQFRRAQERAPKPSAGESK